MRMTLQCGMLSNVETVHHTALRSVFFLLMTIAVVGCRSAALGSHRSVPPAIQSDQSRIQGVWWFHNEVDTKLNGDIVVIPGPSYEGLISYTPDGFVSATVMPKGRAWNTVTATAEQLRESVAEGSSTAYAGHYELNPVTHTVTHTIVVSVDPADEGRQLVRSYAFDSDKLLLSGDWTYRGEALHFKVLWVRAH